MWLFILYQLFLLYRLYHLYLLCCCSPRRTGADTTTQDAASDSDEDVAPEDDSQSITGSGSRRRSSNGLGLLSNGAVSMRALQLTKSVPTTNRDPEAQKLFKANLTVSKAYTAIQLVFLGRLRQGSENWKNQGGGLPLEALLFCCTLLFWVLTLSG